ncbi:MAG: cyclic nucleotide-binding domain-containing protein [Deltaproteobacteria bacterium]|nr:cyclic nucleotide-binding domain-containing protein [Deltaproteobacteria bacterium]MBW2072116.1 cyclic nucleotide-binding domain-containing protein [Deltaproteobacteria bacterium]
MVQISDLKDYGIFAELDASELGLLARIGSEEYCTEGEVLIQAGLPARTLYVLRQGNLMVAFPDGRAITLHQPGRVVGWSALISPSYYTASVICLTDCTFIAFPGSELLRLVRSNVTFGTKIMRKISEVVSRRLPLLPEKEKRRISSGR